MAGHTPGPWRWTDGENDIDISTYESPGYYDNPTLKGAVDGYEADIIGCGEYDILYGDQRVANARLIAAAPELLEALDPGAVELAADLFQGAGKHSVAKVMRGLADRQRAAIAKATQP